MSFSLLFINVLRGKNECIYPAEQALQVNRVDVGTPLSICYILIAPIIYSTRTWVQSVNKHASWQDLPEHKRRDLLFSGSFQYNLGG